MSMKKIIAGVAAAALTVGSLAVVGVSAADDVKTFNFVGQEGSMKVTYSKTVSYLGGLPVDNVFKGAGLSALDLSYDIDFFVNDGYKKDNEAAVKGIFDTIHVGDGTKITVTGVDTYGRSISVTATANKRQTWDLSIPEGTERFRIRKLGDGGTANLESNDIDLTVFDSIRSVTLTNTFSVNTGDYYVPAGVAHFNINPQISAANINGDFIDYWGSYTSESKQNNGRVIKAGNAYTFEGGLHWDASANNGNGGYVPDGKYLGSDGLVKVDWAEALGYNNLRWVNDNIVQSKGAKLRIVFMKPDQLKAAITGGNIDYYPTQEDKTWTGSHILTPGGNYTSEEMDITIGVNLQNTTKLQQTTNIVDYVAEFDWDTLVQNSSSTVSGNVDSIAFRVAKSDNVKKNLVDNDTNWNLGIASIEIVIPDQATVPGGSDAARILTAGSADTFVKLIGTEKTIYGNGAVEVAVENNITNNNVKYAVKLMDATGAYVQPAGEVTLQLSIPTDFRGATLTSNKVRHTCNDGTVEELDIQNFDTYKTDNYIVVKTSKFSDFDFSFETTAADTEPVTEAPATEAPATEPVTEAPATEAPTNVGNASSGASADKNAPTGVALAVVPAVAAAAAVVISKKRK